MSWHTFGEQFDKISATIEIGAVQNCASLVDIETCCKMEYACRDRLRYNRERTLQRHILTSSHLKNFDV